MSLYGYPALYALFVWWFSTGLIIWLDNLPRSTFRWSLLGGGIVFAVSLHRLAASSVDASVAGAYAAFTYGVLLWGWQEMTFFMGVVTGPRKTMCPEDATGWRRFWLATETCLYHELAILATAGAVVTATWNAPNQVGKMCIRDSHHVCRGPRCKPAQSQATSTSPSSRCMRSGCSSPGSSYTCGAKTSGKAIR